MAGFNPSAFDGSNLGVTAAGGANNNSSATSKAVSDGCGGGGCQKGVTGQCCDYQSSVNAACQKAMAPYSDACSSCGGSGFSIEPPPGGGDTGDYKPQYVLSFKYDPGVVPFPLTVVNSNNVAVPFSSSGLFRFNSSDFSAVTSIYISETDATSKDAVKIFDSIIFGATLTMVNESNPRNYAIFLFDSQVDNGDNRTFFVKPLSTLGDFSEGDIISFSLSRAVANSIVGILKYYCPYCAGTGLEGSDGGIYGLVMSVYNGSAEWAGANIDIYGRDQSVIS